MASDRLNRLSAHNLPFAIHNKAVDRPSPTLTASAFALYAHFALQLLAGGLLATVYRADPATAHASAARLHEGGWRLLQAFHYWGSAVLLVHSALHLAAVTWAGWYRGRQVRAYLAALGLAALSLGFQLTGNLLPWDRHGVQTAGVESAIASRVPLVGPTVGHIMLGGDEVGARTLGVWWAAHWLLLPLVLLAALGLGFAAPRAKIKRWVPALSALVALVLAAAVTAPLGSAATAADYGRFDAKPSWYTVPMHGLLVWGDRAISGGGWLGAAVVPTLFAAALLGLALYRKASPKAGRAVLLLFGGAGLLAALTSGGEYAPLVGTRDPVLRPTVARKTGAAPQDRGLAARGRTVFAAQGCNGCHGADGLKGVGGPSLKDVGREHPDADYYIRYVRNPQSVEKGSTMPAYPNLKGDELAALAEFLRFPR